jgi:hypothetical protein
MVSIVVEAAAAQAKVQNRSAARIDGLDWTKGALVLCMVIYHAINYSQFRGVAFRFMAFVPPSFILITGFLVGQVYASNYELTSRKPYLRLAVRGLKLFLIFTALNVFYFIGSERSVIEGLWAFGERSHAIYLAGSGRSGIFEVLLPIAYFLFLAPFLVWLRSWTKAAVAVVAAISFVICIVLERQNASILKVDLLSAGLIGMALGLIKMDTMNRLAANWLVAIMLCAVYGFCSLSHGTTYAIQMLAATVVVFVCYSCAVHGLSSGWAGAQIVLLGKYSLLSYLAQIGVLQVVIKLAGGRPGNAGGVAGVAAVTMFLTFVIVRLIAHWRGRSPGINSVYRAVFA